MKTISYAGGDVLTSDGVADAVVDYAAALAKGGSSAQVTIPVVLKDGTHSEASMLLGPASQLVAKPEVDPVGVLDDTGLIAEIVRRTAALGPIEAQPADPMKVDIIDEYGLE